MAVIGVDWINMSAVVSVISVIENSCSIFLSLNFIFELIETISLISPIFSKSFSLYIPVVPLSVSFFIVVVFPVVSFSVVGRSFIE
ncbi:MAG: hypothetical protein N3D20_00870 [Candidatus Pacearchaeota archaeon]|nr:hypothetical protein [Candidatus Pacearchaeota archaeon]